MHSTVCEKVQHSARADMHRIQVCRCSCLMSLTQRCSCSDWVNKLP